MKRSLFAELRRRNVLRAAAFYIAAVWALAQGIAQLGPAFGMPDWGTRWFVIACGVGFPFWIAFAWLYEFTPEGLKRERDGAPGEPASRRTGRKLDVAIIAVLAVAVVLLVTDRFVLHHGVNEAASTAVEEHSIAVLPFVNMSSDKEQEYFSDGVSEELLNLLAKIPQLQVTARTSSFSFKGKEVAIAEIARTLHVANVLEGSVRKDGSTVRITAQLIRASTDVQLWSQTYDRKLDAIFAIQDEIAADVVKQLKVTLLGAAPKARTTDPQGYALHLQAVQLGRQASVESLQQSDALYRKVLAIDPRYAPAWDGLARNAISETAQGMHANKDGYARAREEAVKALTIDPEYAPAHATLGLVAMDGRDNDLAGAAQHLERALALDPSDLDVLRNGATLLAGLGRMDDALALDEAILRRDPVNVDALFILSIQQLRAGRFDASIASSRTVLSLVPGRGGSHYVLGLALLLKGDARGALAEIEQEKSSWIRIGLPMVYHVLGRHADADAALEELIAKDAADSAYNIAYVYAFRDQADKAFEWLDKTVEYGDPGIGEIVSENLFDKIHADPRWLPFLRRLGKAPEQLANIKFDVTPPAAVAQQRSRSTPKAN